MAQIAGGYISEDESSMRYTTSKTAPEKYSEFRLDPGGTGERTEYPAVTESAADSNDSIGKTILVLDIEDKNAMVRKLLEDKEYFGSILGKGEFTIRENGNGYIAPGHIQRHGEHATNVMKYESTVDGKEWMAREVLAHIPQ